MPRTLAIGDIHGCLTQLEALLTAVAPAKGDHVILLGDFVDRGPYSAGDLNRLMQLARVEGTLVDCIKGNHEQMMLDARSSLHQQREWILNGGDATLASYAGNRSTLRDIPGEHWRFLETGLVDYVETATHIFVHANISPDLDMADQPDYMLRWERCDETAPHHSGKTMVCGHTPQKRGRPMNRGYAICIDTHACGRSGRLTCLDAGSGKIWQADARGQISRAHISDFEGD